MDERVLRLYREHLISLANLADDKRGSDNNLVDAYFDGAYDSYHHAVEMFDAIIGAAKQGDIIRTGEAFKH